MLTYVSPFLLYDPARYLEQNSADFHVGHFGEHYFSGGIDFLRVSKGTLRDAETSVEELYKWQFDGPFLYDFSGNPVQGTSRDAGAVEYIPK